MRLPVAPEALACPIPLLCGLAATLAGCGSGLTTTASIPHITALHLNAETAPTPQTPTAAHEDFSRWHLWYTNKKITWDDAQRIIAGGRIVFAAGTRALDVVMKTRGGVVYQTKAPSQTALRKAVGLAPNKDIVYHPPGYKPRMEPDVAGDSEGREE